MPKNELISLGMIYNAPMHAYGMNGIIKEVGLDDWARVSPASIYNTLARLNKDGCVKVTTEKVGNAPERKVYAITEKGKARLHDELEQALLSDDGKDDPFYIAVMFWFGMEADEAIELLRKRIVYLERMSEHMVREYAHLEQYGVKNAIITIDAARKHIEIEKETAERFIELFKTDPQYYRKLADNYQKIQDLYMEYGIKPDTRGKKK